MPEVPKKPVPEKKVPVPVPKKVEPPPPKGTPPQSEYMFLIHRFTRKIMMELGFRKIYVDKLHSHHLFLKIFRNTNINFSLDEEQYSRTKMKSILSKLPQKFYPIPYNFIKHHNFHTDNLRG